MELCEPEAFSSAAQMYFREVAVDEFSFQQPATEDTSGVFNKIGQLRTKSTVNDARTVALEIASFGM
jgi:hypothetical protein